MERKPQLTPARVAALSMSRVDAVPSPRFPDRFGRRVFSYIVALAVTWSVASTALFYWRQRDFMNVELQRRAATLVKSLAAEAQRGAAAGDAGLCTVPLRHAITEDDVVYAAIYDRSGREIIHAPPAAHLAAPPPALLERLQGPAEALPATMNATPTSDERDYELYAPILTSVRDPAVPPTVEPGRPASGGPRLLAVGLARIGLSRHYARDRLHGMLLQGLLLGAGVLGLGLAAAVLISRRVSRPIRDLIQGAEALRVGDLDARVRIGSRDELGQLAYAFNRMAKRLNESIGALEDLNRDLEAEVARRTAEVQRAADFADLLNAPLGRGEALADEELLGEHVGGAATGGLSLLLDQAIAALVDGTSARGAALWLVAEETREGGPDVGELELSRYLDLEEAEIGPPPPIELLELNVPHVDHERGHLLLPLLLGTEVLGAIILAGVDARDEVVRFASQAASQLAIAIANVRAYAAADRLAVALTERNAALARQRDQLQEMNRLKSEFLANVSHELRTPLNAIIGYGELIADGIYGEVSEAQRAALLGIDDSGKNLLALINQILDLAKVESGTITLHVEEVDLDQLARAVITEASALAQASNRPYRIGLFAGQAVKVRTDGTKVKQIVTNLVSNAVKFTLSGHVDVKVRAESDGGCTIAVADTGIGIKPEDMQIIFEEFRQVDGSYTREFGGTGLGLAISRRFTVLLGGTITVESALGVGSTFSLRLPREPPALAPRMARHSAASHATISNSRPTSPLPRKVIAAAQRAASAATTNDVAAPPAEELP